MLKQIAILAGFSLFMASCSKRTDCCMIPIDPVEDPVLLLWPGEDSLLSLEGRRGIHAVSSDNEEIASVELSEDGMLVTAGKPGSAFIYLDDGKAGERLRVRSLIPFGEWENVLRNENNVVVEAEDAAFAEELKAELEEKASALLGFVFTPHTDPSTWELDSATFVTVLRNAPPAEYRRGSYSISDLTLTLKPRNGEEEEVYKVLPYPDRSVMDLRQDLTEHFRTLHPDKGIGKVTVTLHIRYRPPQG